MSNLKVIYNISQLVTLAPLVKANKTVGVKHDDLGIETNAWLEIEDGIIIDFGHGAYPNDPSRVSEWIDADQGLVMPGLVDCHTHPVFAGSRASEFARRLNGETYQDIAKSGGGIVTTVNATREANDLELRKLTADRLTKFLRYGVTTVEAKTGYGLSVDHELRMLEVLNETASQLPIHVEATCLALHALPRDESDKNKFISRMTEELLPQVAERKLARWADAFVEDGYFLPQECEKYIAKAKELGFGIRIHADEFKDSGAALAAARWGAASADHLEHTPLSAAKEMAQANTVAVLLPGTSLYCKMPYTQATLFREAGCAVALATDFNPGSCQFDNLSFIATIGALHCGLTVAETVAAVTYVAAAALRLEESKGALAKGHDADLAIFSHACIEDWIADLGRTLPHLVMVNGLIV